MIKCLCRIATGLMVGFVPAAIVSGCSMTDARVPADSINGTSIYDSDFKPSLTYTEKPFDLAVDVAEVPWDRPDPNPKPAFDFFALKTSDGNLFYTRFGEFKIDSSRRLVHTASGYLLHPEVVIPPGAEATQIASHGVVTVKLPGVDDWQETATIRIVRFGDPSRLIAVGDYLYRPTASSGEQVIQQPATEGAGQIMQGALEVNVARR